MNEPPVPRPSQRRTAPRSALTRRATVCVLAGALLLLGCQPDIPAISGRSAPPDAGPSDLSSGVSNDGAASWDAWPGDDNAPVVTLTGEASGVQGPAFVVQGSLSDDTGVAAATIQVGANVPRPLLWTPETGAFAEQLLLPYGAHTVVVRAWDIGGRVGQAQVKLERAGTPSDQTPPKLTVVAPKPSFQVSGNTVFVSGTASDDVAVAKVTVQVGGGAEVLAETHDHFAHWQLTAAIGGGGAVSVVVRATDVSGKVSTQTIAGATTLQVDTVPPGLTIATPADGAQTDTGTLLLSGSAKDESGIAAVQVRVGQGPYLSAETQDGFATFQLPLVLVPGKNVVKVRARDGAGLVTTKILTLQETSGAQWSPPVTVPLRIQPKQTAPSTFEIDRKGLGELLPPSKAKQIVALQMSVDKLIAATLNQIRNACGSGWHKPNNLAKSCPKAWGQPELNLWRLVTMTPANVNVKGTSIEGMADIAKTLSQWGLMDSFSTILAAGLGIAETGLIVGEKAVAESMVANVVGSHPNATPKGEIMVTLEDCLTDLKTLAQRYGPAGTHPGFLDPASPPKSEVLTSGFVMKLVAKSNLHWHDGLRLGHGKSYVALLRDTTGPTFNDVLEFNFLSSKTFTIEGLAQEPKVDLAFRVLESSQWIDVGSSMHPLPKGNSKGWTLPPWTLERALIDGAYRHYKDHRAGCDLCKGSKQGALLWEVPVLGIDEAELVVGRQGYSKGGGPENFSKINPNPAGWLRIWTLFGLGSPPKPQYVWDMILGVSQRRLLDGGVKQGQGSVRFELTQVPVGLNADELAAALAPSMHAQRQKLAALLMGDWQSKSPLDIFLAEGAGGGRWLMFVAPTDPLPKSSLGHPKRGFFSDVGLTQKLSSTASQGSGDTIHEKIPWPKANTVTTVYVADVQGTPHRLQLSPLPDGTLWVTMRKWVGGP